MLLVFVVLPYAVNDPVSNSMEGGKISSSGVTKTVSSAMVKETSWLWYVIITGADVRHDLTA